MGEHDTFFKRAFEDPVRAAGELRSVLPEAITRAIDLDALELVPGSFVDASLADRHTDLLFRTTLRGGKNERVYVYLLFEHQSEPDALMPFRVLVYQTRIWDRQLREDPSSALSPIVPLVIHHGERGWRAPRHFHALVKGLGAVPALRRFVPSFSLAIDDLVHRSDVDLLTRPLDAFARLALWLLRDVRNLRRFRAHRDVWLGLLGELVRAKPTVDDVVVLLRYLYEGLGIEEVEAITERIAQLAPDTEHTMTSAADVFRQQGREQGLAQGKRDALRQLMTAKFGPPDEATARRIDDASADALDGFLLRLLTATRLEEVLG